MTYQKHNDKVLIVGPMEPAIGGIATHISDMLSSNLKDNFELIPFRTNRPPNSTPPQSQNYHTIYKVSPIYLLKAFFITLHHLFKFPLILVINKPTIVHIHTAGYWAFFESSLYIIISKIIGKKTVLHIHANSFDNYYLTSSLLMKKFIKKVMGKSDKVIALSDYWKSFFVAEIGLSEDSIAVVRNGIVFSKYQLTPIQKNEDKTNLDVLFMGGMDAKRKGIYDIIQAIPIVVSNYSNVTFILIGKSEFKNIQNKCTELGIRKQVKIIDQITDDTKVSMLKKSDIYLLPSYSEGLPISLLEAMASGLPIISTTVGSIPEVIEEGINGYLIKPGDYNSLAEKILVLLQDNSLRNKIKINNINKAKNSYDLITVAKKIDEIYYTLID